MPDALTDEHHDWMHSFFGVDTKQDPKSSGGGILGAIGNAASSVAQAASGAVASVEHTVSDAVGTAEQAASSAVKTVETTASAVVETVEHAGASVAGGVKKAGESVKHAAGSAVNAVVPPPATSGAPSQAELYVEGAVASVEKSFKQATDAAGQVVDAVTHGDPSLSDLAWTAAGGITHLAAAAVPGGFIAAGAIDTLVASEGSQEQKFWYGVGTTAAGIADTAVGGAEIIGGGGLAPETGGLSLGVSAVGVNVTAAGAEALVAGTLLMAGGPGTGGGKPPAKPVEKAKPVDPKRRQHILDGDGTGGGHRAGTGNGKSEFPSGWNDDKIVSEIESVANDPNSSRIVQPNGRTRVEGTRDGIKIRVVVDPDGTVRTAHPFQ